MARERKGGAGAVIDAMNRRASEDERVDNILLEIADGVHLIFKKY